MHVAEIAISVLNLKCPKSLRFFMKRLRRRFLILKNVLINSAKDTEGLGGNASVRGINRNGVVGNGMVWLNTEFRWRIVNFRALNQNFHIALNPFFDMGQVTQPYRLKEQKAAYEAWRAPDGGPVKEEGNPFYSNAEEQLHATAGCGLKIVMNRNFVISVEMARALDNRDGQKLWNNIGFNYLF